MTGRILFTSFEPFGGDSENASLNAAALLPDTIGGFEVCRMTLPVAFGRAGELAISEAERVGADIVLSVGQAAGRSAVTPEAVAVNIRYARIPDNDGACPCDTPVITHGREAFFSSLPVRRMAEAISEAGIPADVSYSAGTYVCNDVFYLLSAHFFGTAVRVGFIHVPATGSLDAPRAALALTRAAEAAITAVKAI